MRIRYATYDSASAAADQRAQEHVRDGLDRGVRRRGPLAQRVEEHDELLVELLAQLDVARLQHVVAAHLSEQNNRAELARAALAAVMGRDPSWIGIADQDAGSDWRTIN